MFLPNDVIEYLDAPGRPLRILWIDPAGAQAYAYALGIPGALPRPVSLRDLYAAVRERRARLLRPDPWRAVSPAGAPSDSQRRRQLKAWNVVRTLHQDLPALYLPRERAAMVAACSAAHGIAPANIMRYLRRYWERGQTTDALLPDYANSGARGKTRMTSAGVKRGRPRKDAAPGANIDDALRALFRDAVARYAATHRRFSPAAAYRQMLADHFVDAAPGAIPSYGQFSYWIVRDGLLPPAAVR
ncbi:hypothetical protein NM04_13870 [Massilia aurea]|uniref:Uncharacterized protein n=1 Tax=Massilia aurea TaxID=373040 RepID=A0A422QJP0_9BURK|nr:hypothetical protein [Massilia aurea]RNF30197.1 hypothetical protein NM04_13870 [Massilia aurea]